MIESIASMGNPATRGRMAEETHAIAMSRVIALGPQRKPILEALDRPMLTALSAPLRGNP